MKALKSLVLLGVCSAAAAPALAADLPAPSAPRTVVTESGWTYRVTPYGWLTSLNGTQTIRGRSMDVNATFPDIFNATIGDGGSLVALMANMEARNGRLALFGDVIAESLTVDRSGFRTRSVVPAIGGTLGAGLDLTFKMAILEAGASYEIGQFGPVAFDVLAGARYWHQEVEASISLTGTLNIADLDITRGRAVARSGSVDWLDAFAGVRARVSIAPNQRIELRGDLGGGGSRFTWNALAAYAYDFTTRNGVTYSGILGYKALYVDYVKGSGATRYGFDMLQHGPVVGFSVRF